MNSVVIGVGSNIRPWENIKRAKEMVLETHKLVRESVFHETDPIGLQDQPNFINGVFLIETEWDRGQLKEWLCGVEDSLGRERGESKDGPRTIDLDIVLWNGDVVDDDYYQRNFLRQAVREVWPCP